MLPWAGGLGADEAGETEKTAYSIEGAWGAPSRVRHPSVLPRREFDSSPSASQAPWGHWKAVWPQGLPSPSLGRVSNPLHWPALPPRVVKKLREGDRGDNPVLGTASALWPREEGGKGGEAGASVSVALGEGRAEPGGRSARRPRAS